MLDDDMIDVYVDGRFWCRMPRDEFEREYAESRPLHDAIEAEAANLAAALDQRIFGGSHG